MPDIEEHIRKAIEEGQFDNLPGKGKPLKLEENPHENPEWRLTYIMLKNSGFSLPWLEERREIEEELEQAHASLQRAWDQRKSDRLAEDAWQRAVEAYRLRVGELNKRILHYNLSVPSAQFQMWVVNADQAIQRLSPDSA